MMQRGDCAFFAAHSKVMNSLRRPHTLTGWPGAIEQGRRITGTVVTPIALPLSPKVRVARECYSRAALLRSKLFEGPSTLWQIGRGYSRSISWFYRDISWMFVEYANIASSPLATCPATLVRLLRMDSSRLRFVASAACIKSYQCVYHATAVAQFALNATPTSAKRWEFR